MKRDRGKTGELRKGDLKHEILLLSHSYSLREQNRPFNSKTNSVVGNVYGGFIVLHSFYQSDMKNLYKNRKTSR